MDTKNLDAVYHDLQTNLPRQEVFWRRVTKSDDGCWLWSAGKYPTGYGAFRVLERNYGAHVVSYMLCVGEIPEGSQICHKCDVPACVRPDHLMLGNADVNMKDKMQKRRHPVGQRHHCAKLTDQLVAEIRASPLTGMEWSRRLGISVRSINKARAGETWKNVGVFNSLNPADQQPLSQPSLDTAHPDKTTLNRKWMRRSKSARSKIAIDQQ